jgi:glutathione synthase/RimK-type ligase-like ATP-grasp enzyme
MVITAPEDPQATSLIAELEHAGATVGWFHPDGILRGHLVSCRLGGAGHFDALLVAPDGPQLTTRDLHAVYFRGLDVLEQELGSTHVTSSAFSRLESRRNLDDLLEALPGYWLTHPRVLRSASSRALQLQLAARLGLAVPRTCWTNDPDEVLRFAASLPSGLVVKPTSDAEYFQAEGIHTLWASPVDPDFLAEHRADLEGTLGRYQEYLPAEAEILAVVVGTELFACELVVPGEYASVADWRQVPVPMQHRPTTLPESVTAQLLGLHRALGVEFGAVTLLRTARGQHVFLETNPDGPWLWLQDLTGLPIARTLAELLLTRARAVAGR